MLASLFSPAETPTQRPLAWWGWVAAGVAIFGLALSGILFTPAGSPVAVWWPAAGVSVLLGIMASPAQSLRAIVFVLVVTFAANAFAGRPIHVAAAFGVANAAEVAVVLWVSGSFRARFRLGTLNRGVRFAVAVAAGAATAGGIAAATVAVLEGGDFQRTFLFVTASHAAAVLMIAPVAALPPSIPTRRSLLEIGAQTLLLIITISAVFSPDRSLPLAFLPYPILAWAAFRFPLPVVVVQQFLASLAILILTLAGGGPFASSSLDILTAAALVEVFLVTFAGFAIVIGSAQYELRETTRRLDVSARLLSGGIIDAQVGLATVRPTGDGHAVLWRNSAAEEMLSNELSDVGLWKGAIADSAIEALLTGDPATVTSVDRTLTITANPISDSDDSFAVQVIDITSIIRAQQSRIEAERARADALLSQVDLERQREDFVSTTSHELRTPVTGILGYLELISDSPTFGERERGWLDVIERNARRLLGLIEDLLTFGQAREDATSSAERVNLRHVVTEVLTTLLPTTDRKDIAVHVDVSDIMVACDPDDAHRAVTNLLTNAVKFTPAGGRITVSSEEVSPRAMLHIHDTGPGMDDYALAHAFDRFFRAPEAEKSSVPGTGLGLAIVRELMRRNNGNVILRRGIDGGLQATLAFG